jgi:hypothetical protein
VSREGMRFFYPRVGCGTNVVGGDVATGRGTNAAADGSVAATVNSGCVPNGLAVAINAAPQATIIKYGILSFPTADAHTFR